MIPLLITEKAKLAAKQGRKVMGLSKQKDCQIACVASHYTLFPCIIILF